jgi:hypothetical protein
LPSDGNAFFASANHPRVTAALEKSDSARRARVYLLAWSLCARESAGDCVQPGIYRSTLGAFLFAWHHNVRYLHRWRLTRQRKHLVHSDPGPDRGIAQARFANLLGHSFTAKRGYVSQDGDQLLFSLGYLDSLACPDCAHRMLGDPVSFGDVHYCGIWTGQ